MKTKPGKITVSLKQQTSTTAFEKPELLFVVTKAVNTTDFPIGEKLSKSRVDEMIHDGVNVEITGTK